MLEYRGSKRVISQKCHQTFKYKVMISVEKQKWLRKGRWAGYGRSGVTLAWADWQLEKTKYESFKAR